MRICPLCENKLLVVAVDIDGMDIVGCNYCGWTESTQELIEEMKWYI